MFYRRPWGGFVPNSAGKMRPINQQTAAQGTQNRSVPMKASHDIASSDILESAARKTREANSAQLVRLPAKSGCKAQSHGGLNESPTRAEIELMTPTHVTIRTGRSPAPRSANLVKVGSISAAKLSQNRDVEVLGLTHTPSPPSSAKSKTRPSSASRFRNMVLDCRDSS